MLSHLDREVSHSSRGDKGRDDWVPGHGNKRGVKSDSAGCRSSTCEIFKNATGSRCVKSRAEAGCLRKSWGSRNWLSSTRRSQPGSAGRGTRGLNIGGCCR